MTDVLLGLLLARAIGTLFTADAAVRVSIDGSVIGAELLGAADSDPSIPAELKMPGGYGAIVLAAELAVRAGARRIEVIGGTRRAPAAGRRPDVCWTTLDGSVIAFERKDRAFSRSVGAEVPVIARWMVGEALKSQHHSQLASVHADLRVICIGAIVPREIADQLEPELRRQRSQLLDVPFLEGRLAPLAEGSPVDALLFITMGVTADGPPSLTTSLHALALADDSAPWTAMRRAFAPDTADDGASL